MQITTIEQAVAHLVAQGIQANLARAAINEQYCGAPDNNTLFDAGEGVPVVETPEGIDLTWETYKDMLTETAECIELDGEPTFDLQGNYL